VCPVDRQRTQHRLEVGKTLFKDEGGKVIKADDCRTSCALMTWYFHDGFSKLTLWCCLCNRQRTMRELEVGKTLFKEGERWVIKHQAGDHSCALMTWCFHDWFTKLTLMSLSMQTVSAH